MYNARWVSYYHSVHRLRYNYRYHIQLATTIDCNLVLSIVAFLVLVAVIVAVVLLVVAVVVVAEAPPAASSADFSIPTLLHLLLLHQSSCPTPTSSCGRSLLLQGLPPLPDPHTCRLSSQPGVHVVVVGVTRRI